MPLKNIYHSWYNSYDKQYSVLQHNSKTMYLHERENGKENSRNIKIR